MSAPVSCEWVDSHCHLDFPAFDADRAVVLDRARAAGVTGFVVPGTTPEGWDRVAAIAGEPGVHVAYGLHPWWVGEHRPEHLEALARRLGSGRAVAVGECGLDFARDIDRDAQRYWFVAQLRLAADYDLPVIVHAVRALDEVLRELRAFPGLAGVIHGFAGSRQQAEQCAAAGFLLGIGPAVTRSSRLRGAVSAMPIECLLLETDAPDRPVAAHRGERGEPSHLIEVAALVCEWKGVAPEALARITSANANRLYRWEN
jgi:TatD DNase family protein